MKKKRILGILLSFALMLTMMPVLGLSLTAYAGTSKPIAVGTVYDVGDTIVIDSEVYISLDDQQTSEPEKVDSSYMVPEATKYDSGVGQWAFDFGEAYLWLSGNENDDVVGIKCISGNGTYESPYEFEIVVGYSLWVGGTRVTSANKDDVLKGTENEGKVSFTPAKDGDPAKLTLSGATITKGHRDGDYNCESGIYYNGSELLNIDLAAGSVNTVKIAGGTCDSQIGIYVDDQNDPDEHPSGLNISGKGQLTVSGSNYGIHAPYITIDGCDVTASGGSGIHSYRGSIEIKGGSVNASATNYAIDADSKDVIIRAGSIVTASGSNKAIRGNVKNAIAGTGWTDTAGTAGKTNIATSETGQNISSYKKVQFPALYPVWVGGTQVTSANMSGEGWSYTPATTGENPTPATLKLNGYSYEGAGYEKAAIYAKEDLVIETTGTNNVANISTETGTRAIGVDGDLTLQGSGTLNATGGKRTIEANAVTIESGTVNTSNGDYGITASSEDKGNITINGGVVNASAEIIGLQATNDVIIKNGTVIATATGTNNDNVAIFANKNITIEGGNVEATGIVGIQAYENLMIEDGIIKATGISAGIGGLTVTINNGAIEATATGNVSFGIVGAGDGVTIIEGQVTASGSNAGIFGYVKNSIAGTGWTNTAGTEGKADIEESAETGRELNYKKVQFPTAHTHDFTYSADGATITATCKNTDGNCQLPLSTQGGDDHVAKLTIAAPKHTTYGDGKEAAAQITDDNSIQGEAKVQYQKKTGESTYDTATETAPTNAGTYKASITVGGATASAEYTIAKATPTISTNPTASAITYGQTLENSTLTGGEASVPGTFAWSSPTTKPNAAGSSSYEATFTPTDTSNYNTATCNVSLTVNQKEVGLSWTDTDLTYNGQQQAPTATATGLVSGDEGKVNVTVTGGQTNASTTAYTATASGLTGDKAGNYKLPDNKTKPFTISPKSITGASVTLDKTELTFNGSSQTVNVTGVSLDGKSLTAETDYDVSGNTETNKGDYTVTVTGKGNYKDTATAGWKIVAKAMTVVANPVSKTYDGNEYGITVNVTDPASGTTTKFGTKAGDYNLDASPKFKTAGTHTVYFKVSGNSNYNDYTGQAAVTIAKKPVNASVSADDKKYDGNTVATVAASVSTGDLIQGDSIKITGLKGSFADKNAGEDKTVTIDSSAKSISGTGSENYEVTIPSETKASISKAAATIKAKDQSIKVGDTVPDLSDPVLDKHYTVTGLVAGDALTAAPKLAYASKPDNTKAGTYEITASDANAGGNYELSYQKGTLTISEKPAPASTSKAVLAAKGISKGKTSLKFTWNKVDKAASYEVWLSKCGKNKKMKKVKTLGASKTGWTKKKLKKKTAYKFYVVAKDSNGKVIAQSFTGHVITGNVRGKYTNAKSLSVSQSSFNLSKGGTAKISATQKKAKKGKKLCKHASLLRYRSNNPSVATVDSNGNIKAVDEGSCTVYVQTVNGIWKTVTVNVN